MGREPQVYVNEYHNGEFYKAWDGISECARAHSVSYDTIKCLIATGNPLYWEDEKDITFDLPYDSPFEYRMEYVYPSDARKTPVLIIDAHSALSNAVNGKKKALRGK